MTADSLTGGESVEAECDHCRAGVTGRVVGGSGLRAQPAWSQGPEYLTTSRHEPSPPRYWSSSSAVYMPAVVVRGQDVTRGHGSAFRCAARPLAPQTLGHVTIRSRVARYFNAVHHTSNRRRRTSGPVSPRRTSLPGAWTRGAITGRFEDYSAGSRKVRGSSPKPAQVASARCARRNASTSAWPSALIARYDSSSTRSPTLFLSCCS